MIFFLKEKSRLWLIYVGAQEPRMKLKGRSIDVEILQATSPRKEVAWGGEEMNHGTLWYFK